MERESKTTHSQEIKDLVSSLAKAQGSMKPAVFNRVNPHFKSRYADFSSCMDACREPLSENGLAIIQSCEKIEGALTLVTMLAHTSGQWMKSEFPIVSAKMDSQGIGSAMTYAKRYSLCGMVGIVADEEGDDDGEAAVGRGKKEESSPQPRPISKISADQARMIKTLELKLDTESKSKLYAYLLSTHKIENIEDLLVEHFQKVLGAFSNAVKFVEQQKEVANA